MARPRPKFEPEPGEDNLGTEPNPVPPRPPPPSSPSSPSTPSSPSSPTLKRTAEEPQGWGIWILFLLLSAHARGRL